MSNSMSMSGLNRLADQLSRALALLGTLGIAAMLIHVTLDVVLRSTMSYSIPATLEIVTRYYMVTLALLPLAWVEHQRNMIAVEAVTDVLGERFKAWTDVLVAVISLLIYFIFMVATWTKAVEQFERGAYVMSLDFPMPVWPTYFVIPISFGLACLVCLIRLIIHLSPTPSTNAPE
ncbi:TRAP transporter small permease [Saccharospirillum sp.]|uniref:TRAP transporter small permease n=1 Tax=Saccharospirillum sp. TaxID=2033801 RepID=UPI0034A02694